MSEGGDGFWGTIGPCPARIAARRDHPPPAKEIKENPGIGDGPSSRPAVATLKKVVMHPITASGYRKGGNPGIGDVPRK